MKRLLILSLLMLSSLAMSSTVAEVISSIEVQNNAKCERVKLGANLCLNYVCYRTDQIQCVSNSGNFKAKIKIKVTKSPAGTSVEKVRKVIFLNKN